MTAWLVVLAVLAGDRLLRLAGGYARRSNAEAARDAQH